MITKILNNFLKKKRNKKINYQISDSHDRYFQLLEKGKGIKKAELLDIPDPDLEDIVMGWMWDMFNEDWFNQFEIISSLPKPCQNVYSCRTVSDEINNGGLTQLFFNSTGQFADMSIDGFDALGSNTLSQVMKDAVVLFKEHRAALEEYNDGTIESFFASYDEEIFNDLDDTFTEEYDSVDYTAYIKEHISDFGN